MSTALFFLALLAAPAAPDVPTPASVFGFEPCAERKLATYEEIADYFRKLDAASDRMKLFEIGKTAEGRTMLLVRDQLRGEPEEARSLQGDLEAAGAREGPRRGGSAGAREGGEGGRLDRFRSALDGARARADGAAAGL